MSKSYRYEFHSADGFKVSTDDYELDREVDRYNAALLDLSAHCAMDPNDWIEVWADDEDAGTTYLYRTQEDANADPDGSRADAWFKRAAVTEEELQNGFDDPDEIHYLVEDEHGANMANAAVCRIEHGRWVYVDDNDGYRWIDAADVERLHLRAQKAGTYVVNADANDLEGWTPETLAEALTGPLAEIGIEVVCCPNESGLGGYNGYNDVRAARIARIVERVICEGK